MPIKPIEEPNNRFDGDLGRAQTRIRGLVEEACGVLSVGTLNLLSFMIAMQIDDELHQLKCRTVLLRADLDSEQRAMKKGWLEFEETNS